MSLRNPNRKPTHPGAILREDVLPALGMTQTEFAKRLLVSRLTVSELLHEKRGLSPDLAARIGKPTCTSAESWLRMQAAVDLWEIGQHPAGGMAVCGARRQLCVVRGCQPFWSATVACAVLRSIVSSTSQYSLTSSTGVGSSAQLQPAMMPA